MWTPHPPDYTPSRTGGQGSVRSGSIKPLYSSALKLQGTRPFQLIPPEKRGKITHIRSQNLSADSKRFFKSVTRYFSTSSRFPLLSSFTPGCHTQAARLNCRESVYLSNRIMLGRNTATSAYRRATAPTWGATMHDIIPRIHKASAVRPTTVADGETHI